MSHCQAFPRVYLFCIRVFSSFSDFSLLSLRAIPLACMALAFFVWEAVYRRAFGGSLNSALALLSFAVSFQLVYYAAELKPYSLDVLAIGLYCLFIQLQKHYENSSPAPGFALLTLAMPVLLAFSYAAFFVFWIPAYNFILFSRTNRALGRLAFCYTALSLALCVLVYIFDIRFSLSASCLFSYWDSYFISTASLYALLKSFGEGLRNLVAWPFGDSKFFVRTASFLIPLFVIGIAMGGVRSLREVRRGIKSAEAVGCIIFTELFVLGALRIYPFTGERITLFFMPLVFLLIMRGADTFRKYPLFHTALALLYSVFLLICGTNSLIKILKLYL